MSLTLLQGAAPIPISGYLICFVPLATVVLGLIVLFVLTDRHAARPYLRFNPFVAAGSTEKELLDRPPAVGETPAGSLGGAVPPGATTLSTGQGQGATVHVPKESVPPPAAPDRPPPLEGRPDAAAPTDLGRVTGVDLPKVDQSPAAPPAPPSAAAQPAAAEIPPGQAFAPASAEGLAITYIEYDPPGSDQAGEYVRVRNGTGADVDMTGWTLRDAGNKHVFTFPAFTLAPGAEVQIWTRGGAADAANLFFGSRGAIWNNTGDTAILADAAGNEISRYSY